VSRPLRTFSYGGGTQSTAVLVLTAQGLIEPFDAFLFADVGHDSEHPAVHQYMADHALPFAAAHGITLESLQRRRRDGSVETLMDRLTKPGTRSVPVPVRMSNGMPTNRSCTVDFKIKVISKWLKAHGASEDNPADVGIGISVDEIHRARYGIDPRNPVQRLFYPLLDLGMRRQDSINVVLDAGLPEPPRSACYFCPFHSKHEWNRMRREEPDLFEKSARLEDHLNETRIGIGKEPVYLAAGAMPLRDRFPGTQGEFVFDDSGDPGCDSGFCFT
jgi:hypothetical protein